MLNMNSPTVQNLMQSGFNPYANSGYIPQQQQPQYYQPYNPYLIPNNQNNDVIDNWQYSYDPMPNQIVNEARGINTSAVQAYGTSMSNNYGNPYYNNQAFAGYMNPFLINNQIQNEKIRQREMAIQQGRIWRALLQNEVAENEDFDIDSAVQSIESMYYYEPVQEELTMKQRIIKDKNQHIAQLDATIDNYRRQNIPIVDPAKVAMSNHICNYYNHINSIIGDPDNCDSVDYFTRVYPELKYEQLMYDAERFNKNLKNTYNNKEFNKLIDDASKDKPDSYYYKLMESFAEDGVKLQTSNGLVITADEMEVKLPSRLLKNQRDVYLEQKRKFYDAIFKKEG